MRVIQFTDTHLYGNAAGRLRGVETDSSLRTVLENVQQCHPQYAALLVTGDLVQDDVGGYLRFRSIFGNSRVPVLCVPGNHDDPAAMRHELKGAPFQFCGSHHIEGWQFIMLDSCEVGAVSGQLRDDELMRLDAALRSCPAHALVCLHHHPIDLGGQWLDDIGLRNSSEFWRIIDAHPHVRGVICGHVHQAYDGYRGAVRLLATPSTGAQFLPNSPRFALDTKPPAYRRLELRSNGQIDTEVHWVQSIAAGQAAHG